MGLQEQLAELLLGLVPANGNAIGNPSLRDTFLAAAKLAGLNTDEESFNSTKATLIAQGVLVKGKGRGGSVHLANPDPDDFGLAAQETEATEAEPPPARKAAKPRAPAAAGTGDAQIIAYRHADRRKNNPEVGMVKPENDPGEGKTNWAYDPHLDPALQFDPGRARIEKLIDDALASGDPAAMHDALAELKRLQSPYLNWSGKAEGGSFEVDTVSLHVHERIDPASILAVVRKRLKGEKEGKLVGGFQGDLFTAPFENLPLRDAIDFYKHEKGWSNRLVAGDSLLVMNSLLKKEGMAGQVQTIYIDPPYGIKYGSNFQPFTNKRDVKDRKDEDLTQEPEMIKAFRDTWELGIHSYLTYLRDRLLLARELLHESGSVFVQIGDENTHLVRAMLDEIFRRENFVDQIVFQTSSGRVSEGLDGVYDVILWYAKNKKEAKFRKLRKERTAQQLDTAYTYLQLPDGSYRPMTKLERDGAVDLPIEAKRFRPGQTQSQTGGDSSRFMLSYEGKAYMPPAVGGWRTSEVGFKRAAKSSRLMSRGNSIAYRLCDDDNPYIQMSNIWTDTVFVSFGSDKSYVVQTNPLVIERCLLMTTDPGDLVLDPTCGSGTTAFVAEKWGRRWITCDTSRVAVTLAKQRLMTASFDYYELRYPHEGLKGGFIYKTVPHVTLKSIANNPEIDEIHERMHPAIEAALANLNKAAKESLNEWEVPFDFPADWPESARQPFDAFHAARQAMQKQMDASIAAHADQETLYDQPQVAKNKLRITGPFSVEAVPFPSVKSLDESRQPEEADAGIARSGESARQHTWRDELLKTGIRGKGGQMLKFADLETLPGTAYLHGVGSLDSGERVVVSFGPEHAALEQRQVEMALREAETIRPTPRFIVFAAFTFDPEAAKDIDEMKWPGVTLLKAQMNTDLLTEDLKKARSNNQSFWLMGQPDVEVRKRKDGQYEVEVHGFDYFDTAKGELVSGGKGKIAVWLLDTDYDERSLFPRQVFFPMAGKSEGWEKLKKSIRAELNEDLLDRFHGTVSLPFEAGDNRKVAVKIVDDRGIESLKVIPLGF
ncbi:MAG: site-specific DNA-methyltransferase [Gallionellaceae bacterium]|nr:site-specific DNA-methyltransferase [Gallionellaceae bacterium]